MRAASKAFLLSLERLDRERRTIRVMIAIFCRAHHGSGDTLCAECQQLHDYAVQRIDNCPYREDKPTCAKCPIHCYRQEMQESIRRVMRYAGPRMLFSHPVLTLRHYLNEITRRGQARLPPRNAP